MCPWTPPLRDPAHEVMTLFCSSVYFTQKLDPAQSRADDLFSSRQHFPQNAKISPYDVVFFRLVFLAMCRLGHAKHKAGPGGRTPKTEKL